ncbi:achaete-scute homolog 4 [Lepus europaeus]|uniref:achaete-scute homolog 4 n=1 Tax=Lepus europaeus TaxID=9983 RepID=UPI002B49691A|nr:achaete-scute homolog 4 [Lepus europaeus]
METRAPAALLTLPYPLRAVPLGTPGTLPRLPLRDHLGVSWRLDAACWERAHGVCAPRRPSPPPPLDCALEPAFLRKRNERERLRVRCVNEGYARLRDHLPRELADRRLSKVETLRAAIGYIKHLQEQLARHASGPEAAAAAAPQRRAECNSDGESKASSAPSPSSEPEEAGS